jgi:hypothetical protein
MKSIFILFCIISSSFLYCQKTEVADYYPLSIGNHWTYEITTYSINTKKKQEVEVTGYEKTYQAFLVTTKFEPDIYIRDMPFTEQLLISRNNKVLILSNRIGPKDKVWDIDTNRILIHYPLKVGASWLSEDNSDDTIEYKVLSQLDIKVQAGQFKNVFIVKKSVLDRYGELKDIIYYFAPNIGMIKSEVIKEGRPLAVVELISYTIK